MEGNTVNETTTDAVEAARADEPLDEGDVRILNRVRAAYQRRDPMPRALPDRVAFALTVAALEAEVAELTLLDAAEVGVRASAPERADMMTFSGTDLTAMVTLEDAADGHRRISGWVSQVPLTVELRWSTGALETTTDPEGRFTFEAAPGLVHLILRPAPAGGQPPLMTPLFEI